MKDLVVLAADRNIEAALRGLLGRPKALGIRRVEFDALTHPRRDPGCHLHAHEFLIPLRGQYRYALVVFDRHGCGSAEPAAKIEERVLALLQSNGWEGRAAVVVVDPELEIWIWSDSPKVDEALQWSGRKPDLRTWVRARGLWPVGSSKPSDPKEAVARALKEVSLPRSSSIYLRLAASVSVERCADPAFGRLRESLRAWFGAT